MTDIDYLVRKVLERRNLYSNLPFYKVVQQKMLYSLFMNDVLEKPHIFRIELINTLNCNAKCGHCSNYKLSEDCKKIKNQTVRMVLKQAKANNTSTINFLGGESLMEDDIFKHMSLFVKAGIGVSIASNTILLNKTILHKLNNLGVAGIGVTIYDANPKGHDAIIGIEGTFNHITSLIKTAKEIGIGFSFQTIYSKESVENKAIERIIKYCKQHEKPLKFNPIMPVGRSARIEEMLSDSEIKAYKKLLLSDSMFSSHCIFNRHQERCPAGRTFVGITPGGEMMPCYFMPFSLGNIHKTTFQEYLDYAQTFSIFQKIALPKGYCIVAESKKFFKEILAPLYSKRGITLPINIRHNKDLERKLRRFAKK